MVAPSERDVFRIGALVNNTYRIEKVLGRGGMGEVYLARHDVTGESFAIKVMRSEATDSEMGIELMKREQAVRAVYHPAIIRYYELGRTERGDIYLVMDYIEGRPLDARFRELPLTPEETLALGRSLAEGLAACHERGVIHRDLSPDNVLLRDDRLDQPVIIDFGIAKNTAKADSTVIGGQFAGKYTYAPPEQFRGHVDARSDLYALGMTLLAAVRGKAPKFGSNDFEIFENKAKPLDLSDLPQPLRQAIEEMIDPDPVMRPASAGALIERIDELVRGARRAPQPAAAMPEATEETIIAPLTLGPATHASRPAPPRPGPPPAEPPRRAAPPPPPREPPARQAAARESETGGGGSLVAALVLLLAVAGAGVGAWQLGLLDDLFGSAPVDVTDVDPTPDTGTDLGTDLGTDPDPDPARGVAPVEPYRFAAEAGPDGAVRLAGFAPDDAAAERIAGYLAETYGAERTGLALERGTGAPVESFAEGMLALMRPLEPLEGWSLSLTGRQVEISGVAPDRERGEAVRTALATAGREAGLDIRSDIATGPRALDPDELNAAIDAASGCGPLMLAPPAGEAFALGERVAIAGAVPDATREAALRADIERRIGDRPLALRLDVLNEPVCLVRALLPPQGGTELSIWLGYAEAGAERENPRGAYSVGDNPLIDIRLPERASWGHLHVTAVDVAGTVFHLLPNEYIGETRLTALGTVEDGVRRVRVAHPVEARANDPTALAFVIDETFGKTLVIAFHTEDPLFDTPRPISETAEAFAAALEERIRERPLEGAEFATRLIDTRME